MTDTTKRPERSPVIEAFFGLKDRGLETSLEAAAMEYIQHLESQVRELEAEVKRLSEFEWMYKELCK